MKSTLLALVLGIMLPTLSVVAQQDISGDWQGTLRAGSQGLRIVLQITRATDGGWDAIMHSIDQTNIGIPVSSVTVEGLNFKFNISSIAGVYEGAISENGDSIDGTWVQGQIKPMQLNLSRATKETAWPLDSSPHRIQFVTVDKDVRLEVLDWGGFGRPVVLLAGLGNDAHVFDRFAVKLNAKYHVFGITRRGFGASSAPATGYSADRLGDDVLAILDSLKLERPVLVGHSIAGEELSSVASRFPERVAGLVYLDAGYAYAYYDRLRGDLTLDLLDLQKKLAQLLPGKGPQDSKQLIPLVQELLQRDLPGFEMDLRELEKDLLVAPVLPETSQPNPAVVATMAGIQKYTDIRVPVLAIFAVPHNLGPVPFKNDAVARAAYQAREALTTEAQAKAFENGVPSARVVRLPNASHHVFLSNEADVLREINAFLGSLP